MKEVIITSSVLILALLALRAIFANRVRRTLIYGTWLLVALRLLIPLQIGNLSISVLNSFRPVTDAITDISQKQVAGVTEQDAYRQVLEDYIEKDQTVFTPQVQEQINTELDKQVPKEEIAVIIDKVYSDQEVYVPEVRPQVQQQVADTADPVTLGVVIGTLWLLGGILVAFWLASGNLLFVRSLRKTAAPVDTDSPIPVYASEKAVSPCLVGLFRPAVYVTPEVAENKALLHYVMTHELTHYAHRDHIWSAVRCLCLCLHWFNPLVWVAAFCSRRDCELACDEGALRRLGEDQRIPYGKALLEVVRETAVPNKLKFTATTMAESKRQLLQRVNFIARRPRWSIIAAITMLLICALVAGCVSTGAKPKSAAENPAVTDPTYATEPTAPTTEPTSEPTSAPTTAPTPPSALTVTEQQLKEDFLAYMQTIIVVPHKCTADDVTIHFCSRTESGCALILNCACPTEGDGDRNVPNWDMGSRIALYELEFFMPNGWNITFWKDGKFTQYSMFANGADSLGFTYGDLRTVWHDYNTQFPDAYGKWKQQNPGLTEPPQLNFTLLYQVNSDGKTCTITGKGYYPGWDIVIPETIDGYTVTAIESLYSSLITSVVMPDTVTSIASQAFIHADGLRSVTFSKNLKFIGARAFQYCDNLESAILPDSVTEIGNGAFSGCSALTKAVLPKGLTAIPGGLFSKCSALTSIEIPETVASIGPGAFNGCTNLAECNIPRKITIINNTTFQSCGALKQIQLPAGVTEIGDAAFNGCSHLMQVVIPDSVETIGSRAFGSCLRLTDVTIGKGAKDIDNTAFQNCQSLSRIAVSSENTVYSGNGTCLVQTATATLIQACNNCVIPSDGTINAIGAEAFYGQLSLEKIVVPEGIAYIHSRAFNGCSVLREVHLPQSIITLEIPFNNCPAMSIIYYNGTKAQWKAIRKSTELADYSITVHCTDGTVSAN